MRRHDIVRKSLVEYVRGELPANEAAEVERHLGGCRECRDECEELKVVLRAIPVRPTPPSDRQPADYWHTFALRVDARIAGQQRVSAPRHLAFDEPAGYLRLHWKPILAYAGAGALVAGLLGIWFFGEHGRPSLVPVNQEVEVVQAAHKEEVNDYFERSRILLIGIANIPVEDGDKVDLTVERNAARDLVRTARYLERKPIDSRSRELIRELERVLVELANLEEQADIPEVDVIRTGMQQQNLLFKIRMAENQKR
jgi:hypothetical protein